MATRLRTPAERFRTVLVLLAILAVLLVAMATQLARQRARQQPLANRPARGAIMGIP